MSKETTPTHPRHLEVRHLGTRLSYTLAPEGVLEEEFTAGLRTHSRLISYGQVWDLYWTRKIPSWLWAVPGALLVSGVFSLHWMDVWVSVLLFLGAAIFAGAILRVGWRLVFTAFDYEGHWLLTLKGSARRDFEEFLESFLERVETNRYPLQRFLENLPLGEEIVRATFGTWTCNLRYDRVLIKQSGPWKYGKCVYYSLNALRPPVRMAMSLPWGGVTLWAVSGLLFLATGRLAGPEAAGALKPWLWLGMGLGLLWTVLGLGIAVRLPTGEGTVDSPAFYPFQRTALQNVLRRFSRIANLSEYIETIRYEDYWDFHRSKLTALHDHDFLDEWPYRSALSKINAHERREQGGD